MAERTLSFRDRNERDTIIEQQRVIGFFEISNTLNSDGSGTLVFSDVSRPQTPRSNITQSELLELVADSYLVNLV